MLIDSQLSDGAVLNEIGERMARWRLERNLTQEEFGTEAGIGRRTVQRLESGQTVQLSSFVRALRVLGLLEVLDRLTAPPVRSPLEALKVAGRQRQRASKPRPSPSSAAKPWAWGDDSGAGQ